MKIFKKQDFTKSLCYENLKLYNILGYSYRTLLAFSSMPAKLNSPHCLNQTQDLLYCIYRHTWDFDDGAIYKCSDYVLIKQMEDSKQYHRKTLIKKINN